MSIVVFSLRHCSLNLGHAKSRVLFPLLVCLIILLIYICPEAPKPLERPCQMLAKISMITVDPMVTGGESSFLWQCCPKTPASVVPVCFFVYLCVSLCMYMGVSV